MLNPEKPEMNDDMNRKAMTFRCFVCGRYASKLTVEEDGPEGFVLPMGGVRRLQEPACQC